MRLSIALGAVTALLVPALASTSHASHRHSIQVYLHPAPPSASSHRTPTLDVEEAQAVLAHHFSAGEGVDEFERLPSDDKEEERDGGWIHLIGHMVEGLVQGGVEGVKKGEDRARVVIIQGDVDVASILPSHIASTEPAFYMKASSETHKFLMPYLQRASHVLSHILDSLPDSPKFLNDLFDITTSEVSRLLKEQLEALSALASRIPWLDRSRPISDRWESIVISALGKAQGDSKTDKELKAQGQMVLKGALEQMTSEESQPPLVLIIMPSVSGKSHSLQSRNLVEPLNLKRADYNPMCFPSNRTCRRTSNHCFGHGVCVATMDVSGNKTDGAECWSCKCKSGYVGVECQKGDYTFQFVILIFTPLLLLTVALGSVGLLSSIGGESLPSTLTLSMGGKRD